jgi:cysteine sulfinate desulfinase/cysteine desulfurase-like protein
VRQQVAILVNAHPGRVIFMNDGTQPGNFAINGVAARAAQLYQLRRITGRVVG